MGVLVGELSGDLLLTVHHLYILTLLRSAVRLCVLTTPDIAAVEGSLEFIMHIDSTNSIILSITIRYSLRYEHTILAYYTLYDIPSVC